MTCMCKQIGVFIAKRRMSKDYATRSVEKGL